MSIKIVIQKNISIPPRQPLRGRKKGATFAPQWEMEVGDSYVAHKSGVASSLTVRAKKLGFPHRFVERREGGAWRVWRTE